MQLSTSDLYKHDLDMLCECKEFQLECLVLKSPEDDEVRHHQENGEVPSRISEDDVLHFVNDRGVSPVACRYWRSENPIDTDLDGASDVSDSSDFSVWKYNQANDPDDIDNDLGGTEHNKGRAFEHSDCWRIGFGMEPWTPSIHRCYDLLYRFCEHDQTSRDQTMSRVYKLALPPELNVGCGC